MIDIHSHILSGLDDGAQSMRDSLEMARAAVNNGIRKVVATPHHRTSRYDSPKTIILEKIVQLNEAIQQENIPLEVLVGQEVRVFGEVVTAFQSGEIATINHKNYCLIEFPSNHVPSFSEQLFYNMQMAGIQPVIAHPERNSQIMEQPDKLFHLVEKGAISQLTAASVTGDLGKKIQKFTFQLIEANLAHVIATDAHNTTTRPFNLQEAYDVIDKEFGTDHVYMFQKNAELIIAGKMVYRDDPKQVKRRKLFGFF